MLLSCIIKSISFVPYYSQFRALSDQLYRSAEYHAFVREQIVQQVLSVVLVHISRLNLHSFDTIIAQFVRI